MNQEVTLAAPLFVFNEENPMSMPQKCRIPQDLVNFPATSLIIVKSKEKRFICRLFYLNECYNGKLIAYTDCSVEIIDENKKNSEIKTIEKLELIPRSKLVNYSKINVQVSIDSMNLNLDIIKTTNDLKNIVKLLLKNFIFTENCSINCNKYGIKRIYVKSTSDSSNYGSLHKNGSLEIEEILTETSSNSHNDFEIGGLKEAQKQLEQIIAMNLDYKNDPSNFQHRPPCQVLISGPIGSGKTSLIYHTLKQFKCNIFEISSDIFRPYPGETEEQLQKTFQRVQKLSKIASLNITIVLIENIENFCPKFDPKSKDISHSSRVASLIYSYLDDVSSSTQGIVVIGTTSKLELVDIGLRRFNRMGIEISLDMLDETQRCEITKILINRMFKTRVVKIKNVNNLSQFVAENTTGFVGADLEILCQYVLRQHVVDGVDFWKLFEQGFQKIQPSVMRDNLGHVTRSTMSLKDIGGMDEVKKMLMTCVLGPLRNPERFKKFGLSSPSGILLYGPSGCAKTTIVKCLAGESKMTLITVSSAEIYSPYVGESEKYLIRLFNQARLSAPAILFFDEIDTIVGSRTQSNGTNDAHMRILSTILTEGFGGFSDNKMDKPKPTIIIGATNRPECIDDALMRPGRFDKFIHVPAPNGQQREVILHFLFQRMPIAGDVNISDIAQRTELFSGADLSNLCNEAAMCSATRDLNGDVITLSDFETALAFLRPSLSEKKIEFYEKFEQSHREK